MHLLISLSCIVMLVGSLSPSSLPLYLSIYLNLSMLFRIWVRANKENSPHLHNKGNLLAHKLESLEQKNTALDPQVDIFKAVYPFVCNSFNSAFLCYVGFNRSLFLLTVVRRLSICAPCMHLFTYSHLKEEHCIKLIII